MNTWFVTGASGGFGRERVACALECGDRAGATAGNSSSLGSLVATCGDAIVPLRRWWQPVAGSALGTVCR